MRRSESMRRAEQQSSFRGSKGRQTPEEDYDYEVTAEEIPEDRDNAKTSSRPPFERTGSFGQQPSDNDKAGAPAPGVASSAELPNSENKQADAEEEEDDDEDEDDDDDYLVQRFTEAFNQIDVDKEGSILAEQLGAVLAALGQVVGEEELEEMIADMTDDAEGAAGVM